MNVLIVEDSGLAARLIGLIVARRGWTVVGQAVCAADAIAFARTSKPDVVTLDLTLPGGGSLELVETLTDTLGLPVVIVSAAAYAGSPAVAEALRRGAEACVDKASLGRSDLLGETLLGAVRGRSRPPCSDDRLRHRGAA